MSTVSFLRPEDPMVPIPKTGWKRVLEPGEVDVTSYEAGRRQGIEDSVEWMRVHLSGISAPNERDFEDMKEWLKERRAQS